ncbi:MAG TPA: hypothetical protein VJK72_05460 [Candidatus Nanoarchaeia archaeon]|nr:hypothetical protein [Candidatus Nanoarchaeia archaeon]
MVLDPAQLLQNLSGLPMQQILGPYMAQLERVLAITSLIAGGLFGLSLISFFVRFYHDRKILRELRALRHDIETLRVKK